MVHPACRQHAARGSPRLEGAALLFLFLQAHREQAIDVLKSGLQYKTTGPDAGRLILAQAEAEADAGRWVRCRRRQPFHARPPALLPACRSTRLRSCSWRAGASLGADAEAAAGAVCSSSIPTHACVCHPPTPFLLPSRRSLTWRAEQRRPLQTRSPLPRPRPL